MGCKQAKYGLHFGEYLAGLEPNLIVNWPEVWWARIRYKYQG